MINLSNLLNNITIQEEDKVDKNYFSYWYPKIKDIKGNLYIPKTQIFKVPNNVIGAMSEPHILDNIKTINRWFENEVIPNIEIEGLLFIKNAVFSDKFGNNCSCEKFNIASKFTALNYSAMCCGAMGCDELIVREYIYPDDCFDLTIYSGLPFRPEFRVFYDFDIRKVLYTANYWDYDYCIRHLNSSDRIVFENMKEDVLEVFESSKDKVEKLVEESMKDVDLTGTWSIDILSTQYCYWLIDMAEAHKSAYWDSERAEKEREKLK